MERPRLGVVNGEAGVGAALALRPGLLAAFRAGVVAGAARVAVLGVRAVVAGVLTIISAPARGVCECKWWDKY